MQKSMRKSKEIIILILLTFICNDIIIAQNKWTLDQCIDYAIQNNLDIESQQINTESRKESFAQSKRNILPGISASSSYNISFGKSVDPNTNDVTTSSFASNSYSLGGSIQLFNGFINANRIAYNRFIYLAGIANVEDRKINVAFDVMNAFHNALYYKGLLDIVIEQKELSELNLEKVKKEVEIGISAKTDILEIEARLADEELQVIRTSNYLKASVLDLKKAMNYPVNNELELQDLKDIVIINSTEFENSETVFQQALNHLPIVKAKYENLKAIEKALAISKGSLYPSLNLNGGYGTGYYETLTDNSGNTISFSEQFKNNASQYINLSLSVPVFSKWYTRSEIKRNRLALEQEKVELENFENQLYYEIESYCQELSAMSAEYMQAQKQTESNQLAFEVAQKKKEQGLINLIDFYTSKNFLSNAQGELLRSKLQYILKRKTIDFYLGKPVFGISSTN